MAVHEGNTAIEASGLLREGKLFMRATRPRPMISALGLLFTLLIMSGCSDDNDPLPRPSSGPNPLGGSFERIPAVDGSWRFTTKIGTDACAAAFLPATEEGVFEISQSGTILTFPVFNICGTRVGQREEEGEGGQPTSGP